MTKHLALVIALACSICVIGCKKDEPLAKTEGANTSSSMPDGTTGEPSDSTGAPSPGGPDTPTSNTPGNPLGGGTTPPNTNPAIDSEGKLITKEEGKAPPAGRVWCDSCGGHLPKEDAVTLAGKTYCMACAEEKK